MERDSGLCSSLSVVAYQ
ncbi:Tetratricopeptide repeat (TPR)-like superfamily protein [Zea mays]|uniref:Tetratricopeptide repeat (TPR)-like superfamily protein n=1 Tax=Zea mays TaxID=4577 RepID=A0A1D6JNB7_MAIZE|nr:Tetratricopeptide repeat (TPR)-like superfamily protein [Zea mays]